MWCAALETEAVKCVSRIWWCKSAPTCCGLATGGRAFECFVLWFGLSCLVAWHVFNGQIHRQRSICDLDHLRSGVILFFAADGCFKHILSRYKLAGHSVINIHDITVVPDFEAIAAVGAYKRLLIRKFGDFTVDDLIDLKHGVQHGDGSVWAVKVRPILDVYIAADAIGLFHGQSYGFGHHAADTVKDFNGVYTGLLFREILKAETGGACLGTETAHGRELGIDGLAVFEPAVA